MNLANLLRRLQRLEHEVGRLKPRVTAAPSHFDAAAMYGASPSRPGDWNSRAIQAALDAASSAGGGVVVLAPGTYLLDGGLTLAEGVGLQLGRGATLDVRGNFNVITMKPLSHLFGGGTIDVRQHNSFTSACVYFDGADTYDVTEWTVVEDIHLRNDNNTGYGIHLYAGPTTNHYVQFVKVSRVTASEFSKGIYLQAVAPVSGTSWVNGNTFSDLHLTRCTTMIEIDGGTGVKANGNIFTTIEFQPDSGTTRCLTVSNASHNQFIGVFPWDLSTAGATDLFVFDGGSFQNVYFGRLATNYLRQLGDNFIYPLDDPGPVRRLVIPPAGATNSPSALGLLNDALALADKRSAYTVTRTGPTPTGGSTANLFDTSPNTTLKYNTDIDATAAVIEIDLGATYSYLWAVGVNFNFNRPSAKVKIRYYTGSAWVTLIDITSGNKANQVAVNSTGQESLDYATSVSKIEFTFEDVVNDSLVEIERLWAYVTNLEGIAYLTSDRPALYGPLDFNNYRMYDMSRGSTASRPASPTAVEQYFDTTLGKPIWYNGTNWVDATGTTV